MSDDAMRQSIIGFLGGCAARDSRDSCEAVRKAREAGLGRIIKLWMGMKASAPAPETVFTWAEQCRTDMVGRMIDELNKVSAEVEKQLGALEVASAQQQAEDAAARRQHQLAVQQAQRMFHTTLQAASLSQWNWGPRFLVALEKLCRQQHTPASSVCWDPARMVGWKVWSLGVSVTVEDLHTKARSLLAASAGVEVASQNGSEPATGSYFTDYVHYVASHDLRRSPRDVTQIFLTGLLRPNEKRGLFTALHAPFPEGLTEDEVGSRLLDCLGWPLDLGAPVAPLAACLTETEGQWTVIAAVSGNDVRIAAESFCKDLIDVAANELGCDERTLWSAVFGARPDYEQRHSKWSEEIASVTIGSGSIILQALLPLAFPNSGAAVSKVLCGIEDLSQNLNPPSHHQEDSAKQHLDHRATGECLRVLLDAARELVREMPWHFTVLQTTGHQPKVLTGRAWSHSYPEDRMTRILLWSGEEVGTKALVWNPARTNPIMTDPRILKRPR